MNFLKNLFRQKQNVTTQTSALWEDPLVAFTVEYNAGNSALNNGDNRTAVGGYDHALQIWEDASKHHRNEISEEMVAMCLTNRGTALTRLGYVIEAIASFDRSISIRPSFAMAYYGKAWVLEWDERVGPAIMAWETYLQVAGNRTSEREAIMYAQEHLSILKGYISSDRAPMEEKSATPARKRDIRICPDCDTENDVDSLRCKKCGKRFF